MPFMILSSTSYLWSCLLQFRRPLTLPQPLWLPWLLGTCFPRASAFGDLWLECSSPDMGMAHSLSYFWHCHCHSKLQSSIRLFLALLSLFNVIIILLIFFFIICFPKSNVNFIRTGICVYFVPHWQMVNNKYLLNTRMPYFIIIN